MLEMDESRLDYSSQLRPEKGYEVVFAVGTTYSLDIAALLNASLALGLGEVADSTMQGNPVCLLAAVEKLKGKMAVFCEQGRMRASGATRSLCILFEDMVKQVVVNRGKAMASFHPKVWIVEYENSATKQRRWRLVVLSRNLTFDTSWDVAVRLDGMPTSSVQESARPIGDFLRYLGKQMESESKELQAEIRKMAKRVESVRFDVDSRYFDEFEFMPFAPGLPSAPQSRLFNTNFDNAIIVSPFLSDTGPLEVLAKNRVAREGVSGRFALIARDYQLAKLKPETRGHYDLYVPEPALQSVELEGGGDAARYSDLHAKIYFTESYSDRNLYLGSLNASANGFYNNVECLIRFHVKKRKLLFDDVLKTLVGDGGKKLAPFSKVTPGMIDGGLLDDSPSRQLDGAIHKLAKLIEFRGVRVISADEGSSFELECSLSMGDCDQADGFSFAIAPFLAPMMRQTLDVGEETSEYRFAKLSLKQVSAFFSLIARDADGNEVSCVIKCPQDLFDDNAASSAFRVQNLMANMFAEDSTALSAYVDLAFGNRISAISSERAASKVGESHGRRTYATLGSGLYERLLVASMEEPQVLDTASRLINLIPPEIEQERLDALREMVASFKKAVK